MKTTFTSRTIEWLYNECRWKGHELESNCIKVTTPKGDVHRLHSRRVKMWGKRIARLLKYCRAECFRSAGGGMPWQSIHIGADGTELDLSSADKLIALGLAAGFVSIEQRTVNGVGETVPFAVVEDIRVRNQNFRYESGRLDARMKKGWGEVKSEELKVKN